MIQPVHAKGDQSWVFFGRIDVEAETPILWLPDVKSGLIWKDPDAGKDWGQKEKGMRENEMVGWHHWLWIWVDSGYWWWTGRPDMLRFMGLQRVRHDWATGLNWTELILNGFPWKQTAISLSFLRLHPSTAFQTLVDFDGYYSTSLKALPTVIDIMVTWVIFTHSSPFSLLITKMSMFILFISCLITSNLPWFMVLTFQVPMQYYTLQHQTLLPSSVTSTTGVVFSLTPSLYSFWSYFSTDLQ